MLALRRTSYEIDSSFQVYYLKKGQNKIRTTGLNLTFKPGQ